HDALPIMFINESSIYSDLNMEFLLRVVLDQEPQLALNYHFSHDKGENLCIKSCWWKMNDGCARLFVKPLKKQDCLLKLSMNLRTDSRLMIGLAKTKWTSC